MLITTKKISSKFINVFLANLIRLQNYKSVIFSKEANSYIVKFTNPTDINRDYSKYSSINVRLDGELRMTLLDYKTASSD